MANSGINRNVDTIISTLNKKADTNLANSAKASEIENIANSAASAAQSAATVAHAASELINTALPQKVNKNGDTFNGSVVVDGDLTVSGQINATIKGSSETSMSATKDSSGNVIVDTYATKAQLNTTNTNVVTNATNITIAKNRADSAYTLADSKASSNNGIMTFPLDDYSVDFRRAGDDGNYTVSLVTNKTLDNTKVYNTLIDKTGKFLPEFGTDLAVNNATISLKNGNDVISSVTVNNVANATSAASCTGNAATATKATQDSAGQQINTTYIKGLSVSGKTITYTKGDGTTGTITTQDTNTTYSNMTAATASAAGKAGLVPAPAAGAQNKFLRGDATWQTISTGSMTTRQVFTSSGTFTTPKAGVYTFLMLGGGQGGRNSPSDYSGGDGGNGGKLEFLTLYLDASVACTITVGAGGAKSADGGDSKVTANSITYTTAKGTIISNGGDGYLEEGGTHTAGETSPYGGAGGAKASAVNYGGGGGGGGMLITGTTAPTASNGTGAQSTDQNGNAGTGWGAGGGGGGNPRGSATGQGGAGAQGIVVVYY